MRSSLCALTALAAILLSSGTKAKNIREKPEEIITNKELGGPGQNSCFRAAVVDYSPIESERECQKGAGKNLDVYQKIATIARENGAQILLFPEMGILFGFEDYIKPCAEEIPDPAQITDFNPCLQPDRFLEQFPILTRLSCLARDNGLYLVANYGTKQEKNDQPGKYLMLNTNVVFDPKGLFIARYRKWNPFILGEPFSKAPRLEHGYFDTEFGRMGMFTCFDILFKEPAIDLVEQYKIDTAIFPTDWLDELPLLSAIQIQDGWSSANRVNLLASNLLRPSWGGIGSGIYSRTHFLEHPGIGRTKRANSSKFRT